MKPNIIDVLEILALKKQASDLFDELDNRVAEIFKEYGQGRFDYDISEVPNQDEESYIFDIVSEMSSNGQYFKFEIVDNIEILKEGGTLFKAASLKPLSFSSMSLKRIPESLKS